MISCSHYRQASHLGDSSHWRSLTPEDKIKEFRELTTSPYWNLLPDEIKTKIRNMITPSMKPWSRG